MSKRGRRKQRQRRANEAWAKLVGERAIHSTLTVEKLRAARDKLLANDKDPWPIVFTTGEKL